MDYLLNNTLLSDTDENVDYDDSVISFSYLDKKVLIVDFMAVLS